MHAVRDATFPLACSEEIQYPLIHFAWSLEVKEVAGARDDDLLEALQKEIVHALKSLESSGPISGAV